MQVYLSSNETRFRQDVWINNTMSELYIHNLDPSAVYQIQISAHNAVGEGPPSSLLTIGQSNSVAPPGGKGGSFPLWADVQKLCNMCVLSLSWNFFVSHAKYIARPSSKEPR